MNPFPDQAIYYKVEILAEVWDDLIKNKVLPSGSWYMKDFKIKNEKYPDVPEWKEAKAAADKAYRELNEVQYKIRNGLK